MMLRRLHWAAPAAIAMLALAACSSETAEVAEENTEVSTQADEALAELQGQVLAQGPRGEEPSPASVADLTDEEVAQVQEMGATAAIVMHYGGNDWANAQIAGLEQRFEELGIEVVAVTDADFDPGQQVSDLETVMARNPDIIVSIPTDPVATAAAYQAAADAGVELVFMDNVPDGLEPGTDYVSVVSADNYGNGVVSAHLMAKALNGSGKIGLIYHEADFFVTQQRYEGFRTTIEDEYPDIEIVDERGIAGPDFAGDAQSVADAWLTQYPDLDGVWAVWDVPAEGVMAAARAAGRTDLKIATQDLGTNVAIALARDEMVVGLGAQVPFDQGVTEANLAAGALLGKEAPPYVALSALPVSHENVLDAWQQVYHADPPSEVTDSYAD
ncbi:sugar ABC transporter substrate-binding protein [Actinotalea ferrariae CF5-4]|uniref:Sugar ABC transporter substrate-binding protein n=1 Tax=Actinotalea ferrariae CF5-4 TaxID=948458 RepID=A0A021VVS2_9CELL|nr:substrate-binding domain-containing protein [Actinotalea ferrariae]EYR65289.1 sugar ABC transporter substrate-binding protein [Actinotalea ferrariae CF5-4]